MSGRTAADARGELACVLFDLDGTLIDSTELILRSYEHTMRAHDKRLLGRDEWLTGFGTPLRVQFEPHAADTAELDALIATYRTWNLAHHDAMVAPFPGAVDSLRSLAARGVTLGLVTSKARATALRGLAVCGFDVELAVVVGSDDVARHKPDPAPVVAALEALDLAPERAIYVGDSPHDVAAGNAAGVRTAAVAWGPFPRAALEDSRPHMWLAEPAEIAALR